MQSPRARITLGHFLAFATLIPLTMPGLQVFNPCGVGFQPVDGSIGFQPVVSFQPITIGPVAHAAPLIIFDTPEPLAGDLNCDGILTRADIPAFVIALQDPEGWQSQFDRSASDLLAVADANEDDQVNSADIAGVVASISAVAFSGELESHAPPPGSAGFQPARGRIPAAAGTRIPSRAPFLPAAPGLPILDFSGLAGGGTFSLGAGDADLDIDSDNTAGLLASDRDGTKTPSRPIPPSPASSCW